MKAFSEVEKNRQAYHGSPNQNSVHRSAAIFPIRNTSCYSTNISFLNHWKIKRGIPEIGVRHTLRDTEGYQLGRVYFVVDQCKVYSYNLGDIAHDAGLDALPTDGTWEVEFFSARNLFIPFPAIVMNTFHDGFFNQVHAYARSLNDRDENVQINQVAVRESSIDVTIDASTDTFVEIMNGPTKTNSHIEFTLLNQQGGTIEKREPFVADPYAKRTYMLSEVFSGELSECRCDHTLLLHQPQTDMFFRRVFGGVVSKSDGAFSANHSYYDNGSMEEYWTIDPELRFHSSKTFPLFDSLDLKVRLYPTVSPCALSFHVRLYGEKGECLETKHDVASLEEGSRKIVEIDLGSLGKKVGARSAEVLMAPGSGNRVPMRCAFQVCYGSGRGLVSCFNVSLLSPYVFAPSGKKGKSWFQVSGHPDVINYVGIYHTAPRPDDTLHEVKVTLYRAKDETAMSTILVMQGKQAWANDLVSLFPEYKDFLDGQSGFVYAESQSQYLRCVTIQTHSKTGHTSGEHSF